MLKIIYRFSTTQKTTLALPSFKDYQLHKSVLEVLNKKSFFTPSPIQDLCFSEINKEKQNNFVLIAPTGTGKTLAYTIPMIDYLKKEEMNAGMQLTIPMKVRSLIIVPSKELVDQVTSVCKEFTHVVKLKCLGLSSVQKFKVECEEIEQKGVDVVVTTLDRLQRHHENKSVFISQIRYLIIDEVDTLIDSGNEEQIRNLCEATLKRQFTDRKQHYPKILLVGATCTGNFETFVKKVFGKEIKFIIEKNSHMHLENLSHEFIRCSTLDKIDPLLKLLAELKPILKSVIIFCNSIKSCQFIEHSLLENKHIAVSLHGSIPRNIRVQNMQMFQSQQVKILVATDLAARGLDFPFLTHVINFDFPQSTSDYLHRQYRDRFKKQIRAGRTGRAGSKGCVISLYHQKDEEIINELKTSNDQNVPLKIRGSSYSKINREILEKSKRESQSTDTFQKKDKNENINNLKKLRLPQGYIDLKKSFSGVNGRQTKKQSQGSTFMQKIIVPGYKPQMTDRRAENKYNLSQSRQKTNR